MREQRKLAAVLAADVVGYSRLMGRDEAGTLARLKEHRGRRLEPALAGNGGRLVKLTGDGALAEFPSAVNALRAAIDFQRAVDEANAQLPEEQRIVFRVGLHLGDLIVDGDDLYGDGVNIAARLEGEAAPGGIVVSGALHEAVAGRLQAEFVDLGRLSLKNIDRQVQAYRVTWNDGGQRTAGPAAGATAPPPLPDKPSIAVLPFQSMSGDPEQEYFADGLAEDIITELSRFREFAVIARNSTFFYKGKPLDVAQVARDLQVRYVLEGSVRKAGSRVRVTAQLIDAATNDHLWAERYDREYADTLDLQEEITRTVVASIAPEIDTAEVAHSRRDTSNTHVRRLALRAEGMLWDALKAGDAMLMRRAIEACEEAMAADSHSIAARGTFVTAQIMCHLYRWGDGPDRALEKAWSAVERMMAIDPRDARTLTARGAVRFIRGEHEGGLADLRAAHGINPNSVRTLTLLAYYEVRLGLAREAEAHARLALRLSPRDYLIHQAHLALAMAYYTLRDYAEAARWTESAIQLAHRAPIRRALMIACSARSGDLTRARAEITVLNGFAPGFISSVFRGENPIFVRQEDTEHFLDGLRLAGLPRTA